MRKIILLIHTSLDGFACGPKGEMDWIHVDEEMFDFVGILTDNSDTALYGRKTYDIMEAYWPTAAEKPNASKHDKEHSVWYKKVDKYVISDSMKSSGKVHIINKNIVQEIIGLKKSQGKNILMLGSPSTAQFFMQNNLIDEYYIFVNPIILGKGISMFGNTGMIKLRLLDTRIFGSAVVALHYSLVFPQPI